MLKKYTITYPSLGLEAYKAIELEADWFVVDNESGCLRLGLGEGAKCQSTHAFAEGSWVTIFLSESK